MRMMPTGEVRSRGLLMSILRVMEANPAIVNRRDLLPHYHYAMLKYDLPPATSNHLSFPHAPIHAQNTQHTHTHKHRQTFTNIHSHIHTQTHTHTFARTRTDTDTHTQTHTHTHTHSLTHAHAHTHTHTHPYTHTHTPAHTHASTSHCSPLYFRIQG
jgi:hypothetical protein